MPLAPIATPTSAAAKRRRIVDAVADHHDGTVFPLGEHNQNFLIRRQPRTYRVDSQACSNGVRNLAPVPRCENNPLHSQHSQPLQERLCARPQFISQPYLARQTAVDGNGDNDCAGNPCWLEGFSVPCGNLDITNWIPPTATDRPSTKPWTPSPGVSTTSDGIASLSRRFCASATMVWAMICLDA